MRERLCLQVTGTQLEDVLLPAIPAAVQNEAEQLGQCTLRCFQTLEIKCTGNYVWSSHLGRKSNFHLSE